MADISTFGKAVAHRLGGGFAGEGAYQDQVADAPLYRRGDRGAVPAPMMQSPSQCPAWMRSPTSGGRSAIIVIPDSRPRRCSLCTRRRRDVHVFHFDSSGRRVYGVAYPPESLEGIGIINGEQVECIAARSAYQFKTAREPAPCR